jgi:hypothetical protein
MNGALHQYKPLCSRARIKIAVRPKMFSPGAVPNWRTGSNF